MYPGWVKPDTGKAGQASHNHLLFFSHLAFKSSFIIKFPD